MAVLFIGTIPPPISGQALAYYHSYVGFKEEKLLIDKNEGTQKSIIFRLLYYVYFIFKSLYYCFFKKISVIYSTAFGSLYGSIFDLIVFNFAKLFHIRIIVHFQGSNFKNLIEEDANFIHKYILKKTYQRVDCAIVLCESMREQINFLLDEKNIFVVPNFYDPYLEKITEEDIIQKRKKSPLIIGYFSNLVYSKGIVHLLEAFQEMNAYFSNTSQKVEYELWIAGNIMSDEYMSATILRDKLNEFVKNNVNIKYFDVLTGKKKRDFFQKISIFTLPTFYRHEAQPLSLLEAMRSGCVILTTHYKYIPDFISSRNGYLVPVKSADAIKDMLIYLFENVNLIDEIAITNYKIAKENYSVEKYQKLINQKISNVIENIN
ncbi:MAG: glycosyltransferase family 4 protein [Leadbetterella sp.]|nr:glycosyltransferase family 4 protein [Leadbetterella sp.]